MNVLMMLKNVMKENPPWMTRKFLFSVNLSSKKTASCRESTLYATLYTYINYIAKILILNP